MDFLPLFLDVRGRHCAIVGGGGLAYRKAILLNKAGAEITIISPQLTLELKKFIEQNQCEYINADFSPDQLKACIIVIAATDNEKVNKAVAEAANKRNILVNVVDQPSLCGFIMPAIVDRSPLIVAISSSGLSPVLTRKIKELNETFISNREGELAELLGNYRIQVKEKFSQFSDRINFWEEILESDLPELVYSGKIETAKDYMESRLNVKLNKVRTGEVYLVGAGPGDPDLLTLRALRLMYKADVVLYDRLVSQAVMDKVRPDAERIHVGKSPSDHPMDQESINKMLLRLAKAGKRVLRLKGGDPFIFGRGGEEIESLAKAKIPFQIVPGITAASGCASYAGIPLTHRDHAQSVRFLTGHLKNGILNLDWENLVQSHETLVFYVGLQSITEICRKLIEHKMLVSTPIALVQQGTTKTQRVLVGELQSMPKLVEETELKAPAIIIIGTVVTLRKKLNWFED